MTNLRSMSYFKPGDKVIVVRHVTSDRGSYIHQEGVIEIISPDIYPIKVRFEHDTYVFNEHELEHENIFNSPLFQALK